MSEERFQRRVIYLLTEIRDNVKKGNPFNSIVQSGSDDNTLDQNLTLEDFKDFNLSLNVKKDYDICKSIVAQIGGNDYKDHIKKAMQRCMTNKVMSYMNISGKKNKYAFGGSNYFKLVKEVMMRNYNVTENQVVEATANYLKWAPERKDGGGRKKWLYDRTFIFSDEISN